MSVKALRKFAKGPRHRKPKWLGWREFHLSHQSRLLEKDPKFYRKHFPKAKPGDYLWPSEHKRYQGRILDIEFTPKTKRITKEKLLTL